MQHSIKNDTIQKAANFHHKKMLLSKKKQKEKLLVKNSDICSNIEAKKEMKEQ